MELVSIETAEEWKQLVQLLRNKKPTKSESTCLPWTCKKHVDFLFLEASNYYPFSVIILLQIWTFPVRA